MSIHGEHVLMRVFLDSADRPPHGPTFEKLVRGAQIRPGGGHGPARHSRLRRAGRDRPLEVVAGRARARDSRNRRFRRTHPVVSRRPGRPNHAARHDHARTRQRDDVSPSRTGSAKPLQPWSAARTTFDRASNHSRGDTCKSMKPACCCEFSSAIPTDMKARRFTRRSCKRRAKSAWRARRCCAERRLWGP